MDLAGLAAAALARKQATAAARLLGAAESLLQNTGLQIEPADLFSISKISRMHASSWMT